VDETLQIERYGLNYTPKGLYLSANEGIFSYLAFINCFITHLQNLQNLVGMLKTIK
jgi:hypothetical protein